MKKYLIGLVILLSAVFFSSPALAHRSGCHRWHSCPSDSGSYVCGDTGYCSGCGNNYYCKNGVYNPGWQKAQTSVPETVQTDTVKSDYFVGKPKTYSQLYSCKIVGNKISKIYHLKGSVYIKKMNLKSKECFANESDAIAKGYRKAKA